MQATCRKNGSSYLPAIKITDGSIKRTIWIRSRNNFLGYTHEEAAIQQAQYDIDRNSFDDYK